MEQTPKPIARRRYRSVPLAFAYVGLVFFMIVYFARPEDWIPGLAAVPLAKITGVVIFLALFFSFGEIRWHLPPEAIYLVLLVAQLWLAAAFSPIWKGGAINVMFNFSKVLPLVIVIYGAVRSITRLRLILFVQVVSISIIAVASIFSRLTTLGRLQGALSQLSSDPNDLALLIDVTLPFCLALALSTRAYWKKLALLSTLLILIYTVSLTASRAGAIALIVVVLTCVWQFGVRRRRLYFLWLIPVAVVVIWLFGGNLLRQRFEQTNLNSSTSSQVTAASLSALQRKELFLQSLRVTAQHPLLGVGPGNFITVSGVWHVTHNSYTEISAEGGILALLLYLLIFSRAIWNLKEVQKYRRTEYGTLLFSSALKASLAAYLTGSLFLSHAYYLFPYCLVAYTGALLLIVRRDQIPLVRVTRSSPIPTQVELTEWQ
jgi:putative inorganic carbon (hco3(-)) transporter